MVPKMLGQHIDHIEEAIRSITSNLVNIRKCYNEENNKIAYHQMEVKALKEANGNDKHALMNALQSIEGNHEQISDLKRKLDDIMCDKNDLVRQLAGAHAKIADLERETLRVAEENKSFLKVSQIVAYEKENAQLKRELDTLQKQLAKVKERVCKEDDNNEGEIQKTKSQSPEQTCQKQQEEQTTTLEEVDEIEPELSVYEKKIKGKLYYVSDDNNMRIFTIADEGEIGEEVGYFKVDEKGKKTPVWEVLEAS